MPDFHRPLEVRDYPLPQQIEPAAILVRVEMAGICGTDVHLWKGQLPIPRPIIMGHETVGVIQRLGEGVEKDWTGSQLHEGDRVTWSAGMLCGHCYHCMVLRQPTRCLNRSAYGTVFGSWASEPRHMAMAIEFLRKQRTRFPFEQLISHSFPLDQASEALQTTAAWSSRKCVIVP